MTATIAAYRAKLCKALETCMEEPVNLRSVGNCTMLMDAICTLDRPDFYAKLAQAFLMDKDAGGPQRKIAAYYHCIAAKK